jgi:hypothetical protein
MSLADRISRFGQHFRSAPGWAAVLLVAAVSYAARKRHGRQQ